jgi:hypothetical protein
MLLPETPEEGQLKHVWQAQIRTRWQKMVAHRLLGSILVSRCKLQILPKGARGV